MGKLLKLEPGKKPLYINIGPETVDGDPIDVSTAWIKKATKIKTQQSLNGHIDRGNFGEVETIGKNLYRIMGGHRKICVFNNMGSNERRAASSDVDIVTRRQYQDIKNGKPPRDEKPLLRGESVSEKTTAKSFDKEDFFPVPKHSKEHALNLATERVNNEIKANSVSWSKLPKDDPEYMSAFESRVGVYYRELRSKIILVVKDKPSKDDLREVEGVPVGFMALLDSKLTKNQAEYFLTRMFEFVDSNKKLMENPAIKYAIMQVIREEIRIEYYRELQDLYGDEINKTVEDALNKAFTRHQILMPKEFMLKKQPAGGGHDDEPPVNPPLDKTRMRTE